MVVRARSGKPKKARTPAGDPGTEIARLTAELAEAQSRLKTIEEKGVDAFTAGRIESLIEAAQIARGQAFDAALARNKAEGELRALRRAIEEVRGPAGWLLRRTVRRLAAKPA